jgi:hypothetical protein
MIIPLTNITYDVEDALEYYTELETNYSKYHWYYTKDHNEPSVIDPKNKLDKMHGWGIQTIYKDINFKYHCDLDPHNEGPEYFMDTELAFGFVKNVMNLFKDSYRTFLLVYPSGNYLGPWLPTPPKHFRIYIPILSNDDAYIITHNKPGVKVPFIPGTMLLNTMESLSELRNDGDSDLVFLELNRPYQYLEHMLTLTAKL